MKKILLSLAAFLCLSFAFSGPSDAGVYVSGYTGVGLVHDSRIANNITPSEPGEMEFRPNWAGGGKLGYWFDELYAPYFGLQIDLNNIRTDIKNITSSTGVVAPVTANAEFYSATFNAVFRYPNGDVRPYIGAGVGWFYAEIGPGQKSVPVVGIPNGWGGSEDSAFGWQALAGIDWLVIKDRYFFDVSLFAEYKFGKADFSFESGLGLDMDYESSQFSVGLALNF